MRYWYGSLYPDFVGEGTGDQEAIMGAICAVKKASFDGVDCVDEDAEATGTVNLLRHFTWTNPYILAYQIILVVARWC